MADPTNVDAASRSKTKWDDMTAEEKAKAIKESSVSDPANEDQLRNLGDDGPWPDEEITEDQRRRDQLKKKRRRLYSHPRSPKE